MLRSAKKIYGYTISATDGPIGTVNDLLLDDLNWTICYLVADTGHWLSGRKVLLVPEALGQPDWASRSLPVALSREQVQNSPHIGTDEPVSRQMEDDLHSYYGWNPYWRGGPRLFGLRAAETAEMLARAAQERAAGKASEPDPHLRSSTEMIGYYIQARDGEIGHVDDLIIEDELWAVRYLVIDTRNWLPGRKVLVAPAWAEDVDWAHRKVLVDLSRRTIEDSPEYDPSMPVNREYEGRLYDYYGRPKHWD